MERESFVFYTSWLDGIKRFPLDIQREIKSVLLDYSAYGLTPNESDISSEAFMAFTFAKPQIDANNRRYINGRKGGAPKGTKNNPNGRRGNKPMVSLENKPKTNLELTENKPMVSLKTNLELTKNKPNVNVNDNVNVNVNDKEIANATKKEKRSVFQRPNIEEIESYIKEKNYAHVNAEKFYDFYESKNWMVGKNKMSKWKAAVANWERNEKERQYPNSRVGVIIQPDKVDYENMESGW